MQSEPTVAFRGIRGTDRLRAFVLAGAAKLDTYKQPITGCRITVEQRHHRRRAGHAFRVRVDLTVPGGAIVVSHERDARATAAGVARRATREDVSDTAHEHVRIAVGDALAIARRQLQDFARRQRHD